MRRFAALAAAALVLAACGRKQDKGPAVQTAEVTRQDIVVDVEATGVIQPIDAVQVRSKASGQIIKMPVETGSIVKPGDLLVQIDPRDVQNRYDQAVAALQAAQANITVTKAQQERAQALAKEGVITAPELETATLAYANAQSQLAQAKTNLELARIALEDATIRAPIAGTVIDKPVSAGMVISSATASYGGGTVLLTLANLNTVVDSTLVSESDIGNVKPGLTATVKVDAYPNRTFHGVVEKVSPQATVQQSVTMFPVMIRLQNEDRALMPGMNSDVTILVEQRDSVLAVTNDAVRSPRDAGPAAAALGLDPAAVQQQIRSQFGSRTGRRGAGNGASETTASTGTLAGDAPARQNVSPAQCDSLRATLAKNPAVRARLQALRGQGRQQGAAGAGREQMRALLDSLHIDPRALRACTQAGGANGTGGTTFSMGGEESTVAGNTKPHPGLVFVAQNGTFVPRVVTLGVGNYDVTEVLSGLQEGERVALISAAMLQQARTEFQQRIQSRVGLPGVQQQQQRKPSGSRSGGGR